LVVGGRNSNTQPSQIPGPLYAILIQPASHNMKFIYFSVAFTLINVLCLGQDSLWQEVKFNDVLSFSVPVKFQSKQAGYVKACAGELNSNYYGFQYADTVMGSIEDSNLFRVSLLGFISARASDPILKGYSAIVTDTIIGNTSGIIGGFSTLDTSQFYKRIYYYVTTANDRYCWFFAYTPSDKEYNEEIDYFFKSIKFVPAKLKETKFKLSKVYLTKERL